MEGKDKGRVKSVLVVHEDQDVLVCFKLILESHGYRALMAYNPEIAEQFLTQDHLPIDLMLADAASEEFAAKTRMLRPSLPVLFLSRLDDSHAVRLRVWEDTVLHLLKDSAGDPTFLQR